MRTLFVYVTGRLSDTPSLSRGFNSLAYDVVRWWDERVQTRERTCDFVDLHTHMMAALGGTNDGNGVRAIRPSHSRIPVVAMDDIRSILDSTDSQSVRMCRIARRLDSYAAHSLIASPVVDAPARLYMHSTSDTDEETFTRCLEIEGSRSQGMSELTRLLCEQHRAIGRLDFVVFYDAAQMEYIFAALGERAVQDLWSSATKIHIRELARKENLAPGMPLSDFGSRLRRQNLLLETENRAELMSEVFRTLGIGPLLSGICKICGVSSREAAERGIRFRCMRLIQSHMGRGAFEDKTKLPREDTCAIQGGHVIEPSVSLVASPLAVIDFASLYPSIIAGTSVYKLAISSESCAMTHVP